MISNFAFKLTDSISRATLHLPSKELEVGAQTQRLLIRRCLVHPVTVVAIAALCLIGTSSLVLADDALKSEMGHMKDEMKAGKDAMKAQDNAMENEMRAKKGGKKGPIMQYREKMKAKRHEMMNKMKAHKDAPMADPTAPVTTPAPAP